MIELQVAEDIPPSRMPSLQTLQDWANTVLQAHQSAGDVVIRIAGNDEVQLLNATYRQKNNPTNVLSFPAELPPGLEMNMLGDIIIAAAVVDQEAEEQGKSAEAHWAHMVVHGLLHLLGYDHIEDSDAEQMEAEETRILLELGFDDPYVC